MSYSPALREYAGPLGRPAIGGNPVAASANAFTPTAPGRVRPLYRLAPPAARCAGLLLPLNATLKWTTPGRPPCLKIPEPRMCRQLRYGASGRVQPRVAQRLSELGKHSTSVRVARPRNWVAQAAWHNSALAATRGQANEPTVGRDRMRKQLAQSLRTIFPPALASGLARDADMLARVWVLGVVLLWAHESVLMILAGPLAPFPARLPAVAANVSFSQVCSSVPSPPRP